MYYIYRDTNTYMYYIYLVHIIRGILLLLYYRKWCNNIPIRYLLKCRYVAATIMDKFGRYAKQRQVKYCDLCLSQPHRHNAVVVVEFTMRTGA